MTPSPDMLDQLAVLLATDPTTLADPANALHVHLIKQPFNPAAILVPGDVVPATFTGSTPLAAGLGAQQNFINPTGGLRTIQLKEPAGGWHWICTVLPAPAETIYGWMVTDNTDAVLYGSANFDTPVVISGVGEAVDIPFVRFAMSNSALA